MNSYVINSIIKKITRREENLFHEDVERNKNILEKRIKNKSALIIGGAGTIGSNFIKELVQFQLSRLYIIDTNENDLAEIVRELRSSNNSNLPEIKTYAINFSSPVFEKIYFEKGPFEIVANFAAHKHVRSEKDEYSTWAMFENNFINANKLLTILLKQKPEYFFCVSTDKATNPVSVMGATKKIMEDIIFSYQKDFNITTARFANVAFSNGSLLDSFINRIEKNQPIACPSDVSRYFVSPEEAGKLCLLACLLGESGNIFIPRLSDKKDLIPFKNTMLAFFEELKIKIDYCSSEEEAKQKMKHFKNGSNYPVYLFSTDTSGEKLYEEFFTEDDKVNWELYTNIGVIKEQKQHTHNVISILREASDLFNNNLSKESIIEFLNKYVSDFSHIEKGKHLDQKM